MSEPVNGTGDGPAGHSGGRRTVRVNNLARVEGEGALLLRIKGDEVADVKLRIFEPPRFFEAFLQGRHFTEAPDITARICGICPVAYQMSSCHAMETACGVKVSGPLRELRRLLYCGEWLESHALHVYFLHAPDFLGYPSVIHMARDHPEPVERGLKLKKLGNDLLELIGGRAVHPVNVRVGGFHSLPSRGALAALVPRLEQGKEAALETVRWAAGFDYPELEEDYEFVSLRHPDEYPLNEGRLVSSAGLDIDFAEYEEQFEEIHVRHSTALHSRRGRGGRYLVGPLARYNLNFDRLPQDIRDAARSASLDPVCRNPFKSILVRGLEMAWACVEALRILGSWEPPQAAAMDVRPSRARGCWCSEAPRGTLYHRYDIDDDGLIATAKIVAPTSQNLPTIESDLRSFAQRNLDLADPELTLRCEQVIRNHDPCISCSTHFMKLRIDRS